MKKSRITLTVLTLVISILLCSCSYFSADGNSDTWISSEREESNARMEELLEALDSGDREAVKSIFSQQAIDKSEDFESNLDELMEIYQGEFVSYDDWGSVNTDESFGGGQRLKILYSTYDVTTTQEVYRIAVKDIVVHNNNEDNVGILSLYIIKYNEDTDTIYAYSGDGNYTPGININIKNVITNELAK